MYPLRKSKITGIVKAVYINPDRENGLDSEPRPEIMLEYAGIAGDAHAGLTRPACSRVKAQYERGSEIRNTRQLSIVSAEELQLIAEKMGIPEVKPEWIGASLCVSGIPEFSHITPSTRLIFESGAALVVDLINHPCKFPGEIIDRHHPGLGSRFASAAVHKRGVTAWVEREGPIRISDKIAVHLPDQRKLYQP